jgi:SAM-dependent methyltransferase
MKYEFRTIVECNMCGSSTSGHKILGKRMNKSQGKRPWKNAGITTTIFKCSNCSLIYSNPQPVPINIQDHYGIPPEEYWTDEYLKVDATYFTKEIQRSKELNAFSPGMKALDIGAGLGNCMIALEAAGYEAYGIEPSVPFYERAISMMKINPDRLKFGMLEEVDYPPNEFDFITFGAVLEHLYDPSASLKRALNWLKPGGIIQIEVPSSRWLIHKLINLYYKLRGTDYVGNLSPMHTPFHLYEFDLVSFQKNGAKVGYEIAFYEYYICQTYLPSFLDKFIKPIMRKTNSGMQLCVWLRKTA